MIKRAKMAALLIIISVIFLTLFLRSCFKSQRRERRRSI